MRAVALLVMLLGILPAQNPGAVFLMIFPDARTTGLGGCGTASSDIGPNSYYNPAVLGFGTRLGATWSGINWLPGLYPEMAYEYGAVGAMLTPKLGLGASFTYLTTGVTQVVDENGNILGSYRSFDLAPSVGLAYRPNRTLSAGAAAKFIYSNLIPDWFSRWAPLLGPGATGATGALDAGIQYRPVPLLGLGLALNNLGPGIRYSDTSAADPLPSILRFGWELKPIMTTPAEVRISGDIWRDLVTRFDTSDRSFVGRVEQFELGLGLELRLFRIASLRLGYFEDIMGQRGGIIAFPTAGMRHSEHISIARWLEDPKAWEQERLALNWGVGVEYSGFRADVGVDANIYDFPTRNLRFQLSWAIP